MKRYVMMVLATWVALLCASHAVAEETVTVVYEDGRRAEGFPAWTLEPGSKALYLRASDVALIFKATQFWNASSRKVVLGIGRTRFTITVDTRVVVIDGEPLMMRAPVRYDNGFVMIPLEFVLEVAPPFTPNVLTWDPSSKTLNIEKVGFNVEQLAFSTTGSRSTATITLTENLVHHIDSNTPGLVRVKIYGGRIDPAKFETREEHGLFNGVRAEQTDRDAFVYFDIKRATSRVLVERQESPDRIVIILEKGDLPEIPDPDFAGRREVIVDDRVKEHRDLRIQKVVLDAGHGGKDEGKRGTNGVLEKDVNLAIAKRTRDVLQNELGLEVILTREDDRLLSLTHRTEIANEAGGDLFISIHCNSWFSDDTGGFEAYFLSPARNEWDRAVAMAENVDVADPGAQITADIDFILWDLVQNEFINESSDFAELIQKAMNERLSIRNRGVKQANFTVLQGARMPAILIETAFLSNPSEESLLTDVSFQGKVAAGIADAVRKFKDRYER